MNPPSIRLDQPLPPGAEKFSNADLLQTKAEARVRQDFDWRVAAIKTDELDQYRDLTAEIRARSAQRAGNRSISDTYPHPIPRPFRPFPILKGQIMIDDKIAAARESFSGKGMTDTQLKQAVAIADIIHAEIQHSGSFFERLTDFSHAFARSEKFDTGRAEMMIRDVYKALQGQPMNQIREGLAANEKTLQDNSDPAILLHAESVLQIIQDGPTQPYYKAMDQAAVALSTDLKITQSGAQAMMKDAFAAKHGEDLYSRGKAAEEAYHKPVREAEIAARKAEKLQARSQSYTRS